MGFQPKKGKGLVRKKAAKDALLMRNASVVGSQAAAVGDRTVLLRADSDLFELNFCLVDH